MQIQNKVVSLLLISMNAFKAGDLLISTSYMPGEFKILIIEDNPTDEQLLKATLSPLPVSIDIARSGTEGYQKLKSTSYDLMILDLILPNTSGLELLRKAHKENLALPISIVCSGLSAESYIMECLKLGVSSYLIKPISPLSLLNSISDCLAVPKRKTLAQLSPSSSDNKPLTLTKAMAEATCTKKTGQILVDTPEGVGVLEYTSGKLTAVHFNECNGLQALEMLRKIPHRSITLQFIESAPC